MKFKLLSDLHLEFYGRPRAGLPALEEWQPQEEPDDHETVLLLPGDIHVGRKALPWLEEMADRYLHILYVAGNHEFYGHVYQDVLEYWNEVDTPYNFNFLENDYVTVEDVRIFGATLWTYTRDPLMIWMGPQRMADYQTILFNEYGHYRKLNVDDTNAIHVETVKKLRQWLATPWDGKTIVMTHHLPHPLCVAERFKGNALNAFFMTNLDDIIEQYEIDFWVHGHTHDNVDVEVHGTRILCNPMGYHGVQLNQDFNEGLTFDA